MWIREALHLREKALCVDPGEEKILLKYKCIQRNSPFSDVRFLFY